MKKEIKEKLMGMKKSELVEIILRKDDVERKHETEIKVLTHAKDELYSVAESYKETIDELTGEYEEYKARIEKQSIVFAISFTIVYVLTVSILLCTL